jgi:MSHA biogenesis protein MshQ
MRTRVVALTLTLAGCLDAPPDAIGPGPPPGVSYHKRLTVPTGAVGAPLDDFPVLVNLATDADLAARAAGDGLDLAFRDSAGEPLAFELELWKKEAGQLRAWVKLPFLDSDADTDFYLHYGAPNPDPVDPAGVWTNGYAMVFHLEEEPNLSVDATGSGHFPVLTVGNVVPGEGYLGRAQWFRGGVAYIDLGQDLSPALDAGTLLTVTAWVRYGEIVPSAHFVTKARTDANDQGWGMGVGSDNEFLIRAMDGDAGSRGTTPGAQPTVGTWYHWAMVFDGSEVGDDLRLRGFRDGEAQEFDYPATIPPAFDAEGGPLYIGCATWNLDYCITGVIDELHIAPVARSPAWIAAEYANQVAGSEFLAIGDEETD